MFSHIKRMFKKDAPVAQPQPPRQQVVKHVQPLAYREIGKTESDNRYAAREALQSHAMFSTMSAIASTTSETDNRSSCNHSSDDSYRSSSYDCSSSSSSDQ